MCGYAHKNDSEIECIHTRIYACMCTYVYACAFVCIDMRISVFVYTCESVHAHMHVYMHDSDYILVLSGIDWYTEKRKKHEY